MPTGRSPTAENPGCGLARHEAKLSKHWSARSLGEASPRGPGPTSSPPDWFLDLYQYPARRQAGGPFFLSPFYLLLSAPLFVQQKALVAKCPPVLAPTYRRQSPRHLARKAALPAPQREAA